MKIKLTHIALLFCGYIINAQIVTGKSFATRSVVLAQNGIVTLHPLASQIGLDILKRK